MNKFPVNLGSKYSYTIVSVIAFIIVAFLYFQEINEINFQLEQNLVERTKEASSRLSKSISLTAWEVYEQSTDRKYPESLAAEILDSELETEFISAIVVLGNFGHLLMGRQKDITGMFVPVSSLSSLTINDSKKVRTAISQGSMTIGHIEIFYTEQLHLERAFSTKLSSTIRFFTYSFLLQTTLYLLYRSANKTLKIESTLSELNNTQDKLIESEKLAGLGTLVAGVAHELNTPLGISVTSFSLIETETKNIQRIFNEKKMTKSQLDTYFSQQLETIELSNKSLKRAVDLVNHFKQTSTDLSVEDSRLINVFDYINEVMVTLEIALKHTGCTFNISGNKLVEIYSNPGSIAQIVTNLVNNSVLHAFDQKGGHIDIMIASVPNGGAKISFIDNGKGMSEEVVKKIYEPFFTTRRGHGGTGLGMNIVFNVISKKLQGNIEVASTPDEGSTFIVTLPKSIESTSRDSEI
jgi:signal transduction histidine kinase